MNTPPPHVFGSYSPSFPFGGVNYLELRMCRYLIPHTLPAIGILFLFSVSGVGVRPRHLIDVSSGRRNMVPDHHRPDIVHLINKKRCGSQSTRFLNPTTIYYYISKTVNVEINI